MPPNYPQQPIPPKKKSKTWLIVTGVIVGAVVLCGVFAAVGSKSNTGTKVDTTTTSNTTSNTTNSQPAQHFKAGDSVKVGDAWQIVVNSVKTDSGGQYSVLKPGDVYLLIDVTMTNVSNQEQTTSSILDWTLKGTDGQKYDSSFFSGASAAPDGKVEACSPAKGTLSYEVPSTVKSFQLAFENNVFTSGQTIWDLTVS